MEDDGFSLGVVLEEALAAVCSGQDSAAAQQAVHKAERFAHLARSRVLSTAQKVELAGALPAAARRLLLIDASLTAGLRSGDTQRQEAAQTRLHDSLLVACGCAEQALQGAIGRDTFDLCRLTGLLLGSGRVWMELRAADALRQAAPVRQTAARVMLLQLFLMQRMQAVADVCGCQAILSSLMHPEQMMAWLGVASDVVCAGWSETDESGAGGCCCQGCCSPCILPVAAAGAAALLSGAAAGACCDVSVRPVLTCSRHCCLAALLPHPCHRPSLPFLVAPRPAPHPALYPHILHPKPFSVQHKRTRQIGRASV